MTYTSSWVYQSASLSVGFPHPPLMPGYVASDLTFLDRNEACQVAALWWDEKGSSYVGTVFWGTPSLRTWWDRLGSAESLPVYLWLWFVEKRCALLIWHGLAQPRRHSYTVYENGWFPVRMEVWWDIGLSPAQQADLVAYWTRAFRLER